MRFENFENMIWKVLEYCQSYFSKQNGRTKNEANAASKLVSIFQFINSNQLQVKSFLNVWDHLV